MDSCKCLMIFFNTLFLLGAIVILGLGIWINVDFESFSATLNSQSLLFVYASYVAIAVGAVTLLLSLLGCIGAWKESRCLLLLFAFFLVLLLLAEIALLVLAFAFSSDLERLLTDSALETIRKHYGSSTATGISTTTAWDFTQTTAGCCGFRGGTDYLGSSYDTLTATVNPWPITCCLRNGAGAYVDVGGCLNNNALATTASTSFASVGCYSYLRDLVLRYALVVGGVTAGIMVIHVLAIIFACCFSSNIKNNRKVETWN